MKLFDAHTHLNDEELYPQWEQHLSQFVQSGGIGVIISGASDAYNHKGIEIAKKALDCTVKATIGYHPDVCLHGEITQENIQQKISDLKKLYIDNKDVIVAIGECGIDTYYPGTEGTLPLQKELFTLQCDLAQELHLPLMVHVRKDFATGLEILKNYRDMTIHFHCRSFGSEELETLKRCGGERGWKLFIGFCGNITYKNARSLRNSLQLVALDQLLLETDAPWLSPQVVRGTMNSPANISYIYTSVADQLHIPVQTLELHIEQNIKNLYPGLA